MPKKSIYNKIRSRFYRVPLAVFLILIFITPVDLLLAATFNKQINYQGKLTSSTGVAVTTNDYNLEFKIYDESDNVLWTETRTGANRVRITNGLFSVMLGEITPISTIDWNQPLYLGVNVGGTGLVPIWDGEMSPRKVFGSVPSAFESDKLDGLDSAQFIRSDSSSTIASSSADTLLTINQTGGGDLFDLKINNVSQFSVNNAGLTTAKDLTVTGGITLGGVYMSSWPAGGGAGSFWATSSPSLGYPTLAGNYAIVIGGSATTSNVKFEVIGNTKLGGNLTTTGSVAVGTTSVSSMLTVSGSQTTPIFTANQNGSGNIASFSANGTTKIGINQYGAMELGTQGGTIDGWLKIGQAASGNMITWGQNLTSSNDIFGQLGFDGGSKTVNFSVSNADLVFKVGPGGAERLRIASTTGAIGIGINNPQSALHLKSSGSSNGFFQEMDDSTFTIGNLGQLQDNTAPFYISTADSELYSNLTKNIFSGKFGVGTTSPSNALEVSGNGFFTGNLTAANLAATGTLSVLGTGSSYFSGRVGVGTTTNSTSQFSVASSTGTGNNPVINFAALSDRPTLQVKNADGGASTYVIFDVNGDNTNDVAFGSSYRNETFNRFAFDISGLLSWGTGSGSRDTFLYRSGANALKTDGALNVAGTLTVSNLNGPLAATNGVVSATSSLMATYGGTGMTSYTKGDILVASSATNLTALGAAASGNVLLSNGTGQLPSWGKVNAAQINGTFATGSLVYFDGIKLNSTSSPVVGYITATSTTATSLFAGNLTVGDGIAPRLLTVNGKSLFNVGEETDEFAIYSGPNGSNVFRYNGSDNNLLLQEGGYGNVGIGTISPQYALHVFSATNNAFAVGNTSAEALMVNSNSFDLKFGDTGGVANSTLLHVDDSNNRITLENSSVGIGTSSPAYRFSVAADTTKASTTPVFIVGTSTTPLFTIYGNGNTRTLGNLTLGGTATRTIATDDGPVFTSNGTGLVIKSGSGNGNNGGPLNILAGSSGGPSALGGDVVISAGGYASYAPATLSLSGYRGSSGIGGNVTLKAAYGTASVVAGTTTLAGGDWGTNTGGTITLGPGATNLGSMASGHITLTPGLNGTKYGDVRLAAAGGRVGIGTLYPNNKLEIKSDGSNVPAVRIDSGATDVEDANIAFYDDGIEQMRIGYDGASGYNALRLGVNSFQIQNSSAQPLAAFLNTGLMGIGTVSPNYKFQLHTANVDASPSSIQFTGTDTGSASTNGLVLGLTADETGRLWHYGNENLIFGTNNTERLRINANGNISFNYAGDLGYGLYIKPPSGIDNNFSFADQYSQNIFTSSGNSAYGTLSVSLGDVDGNYNGTLLTVDDSSSQIRMTGTVYGYGDQYVTGRLNVGSTSYGAGSLNVWTSGGSSGTNTGIYVTSGNTSNYFGNSQLVMGYAGTQQYAHSIKTRHNAGSQIGNAIDFYVWNQGTDAAGTVGTKNVMTLDGNGNVGIGTTTPTTKLSLVGELSQGSGQIIASNYGMASGYTGTRGNITASGYGSHALGFAYDGSGGSGSASILASGSGSLANGYLGGYSATQTITASGSGSFASGYGSSAYTTTNITASGNGATALGYMSGNSITASGAGSFAGGYASSGSITASGAGSFAWGNYVQATNSISFAFGYNFINSTANTFQVGYSTTPTLTVNATNIGISQVTPVFKLDVAGNARFTSYVDATYYVATSTTATSTFKGGLVVGPNNNLTVDYTSGVTSISSLEAGALNFDTNAGAVTWFDMPVTSAAASSTAESYTASINGNSVLTVYGQSNGAGGVVNLGVGIGTITPVAGLEVRTVTGDVVSFHNSGGTGLKLANGGTSWTTISDARLKENVTTLASSTLDKVLALRPVSYTLKDPTATGTQIGFIAQEVESLFPEFVTPATGSDGYYSMIYDRFGVVAIRALQELAGQFNSLVDHIADGIAYLKDIAVASIIVGSPEKPTGITLYDRNTGEPYCLMVVDGETVTADGDCASASFNNNDQGDDIGGDGDNLPDDTASSTDNADQDQTASSTDPTGSDTASSTDSESSTDQEENTSSNSDEPDGDNLPAEQPAIEEPTDDSSTNDIVEPTTESDPAPTETSD